MRAFAQSRCTVRVVMPSASAVSSSLSPPKKRHSTTRASRGSTAASRSSASLSSSIASGWSSAAIVLVVERDALQPALPFLREPRLRAIDEHVPHRHRRQREEMRAVAPRDARLIDELEVRFVDEPGRGQRAAALPHGELAPRDLREAARTRPA